MISLKKKRFVVESESMMMEKLHQGRKKMAENVKKANVTKTYHTANGALIKGTKVRVEDTNSNQEKIRVTDDVGRLFWVERKDVKLD